MASPSPPPHAPLQPWLGTLVEMRIQPSDLAHRDGVPTISIVWVCPGEHNARNFEALELFVLLAKADPVAWRSLVEELQAASGPWVAHLWKLCVLEPEQQPQVAGVDLVCSELSHAVALTTYLKEASGPDDAPPQDYLHQRAILEQSLEDTTVEACVRLKLARPWRANVMEALPAITELGALQTRLKEAKVDEQVQGCRLATRSLRVVAVHNDITEFTTVDDAYLNEMVAINHHGIKVADLPPLELVIAAPAVNALNSLLGTSATGREGCVERVVTPCLTQAMGLSSAVAFSQSVRDITVTIGQDIPIVPLSQRSFYWLAFALFSPHASHRIEKTRMCCTGLTSEIVQWIQELLEAEDPLQLLFSENARAITEFKDTRVSTSNVLLQGESVDSCEAEQILTGTQFDSLRVLGRDEGGWSVLLPGWGRAWVRDGDATITTTTATAASTMLPTVRPIPLLQLWGLRQENKAAILQLLQLIGPSVQSLDVEDSRGTADTWCFSVLEACPNLEDFKLMAMAATSDNLLGFAEIFAAGHCNQLKRMALAIEMLTEQNMDEVTTLLHILADYSHPMTQQLEVFELDVFCMIGGQDVVDSNVLVDALQMLERNRTLSFFKLHLPLATSTPETTTPQIKAAFERHHDVLLPTPREPMSNCTKAAFLSVIWGNAERPAPIPAMELLDSSLVKAIFEFVPDRRRRLIDVTMPRSALDAEF